tara:strand:- start:395 stop:925 length:531 start_codon:yes stop_codon:yes gene_type:complete
MENSDKRKERVIPGDELAVIEEYESGKGTHIIDGQIRASIFGKTKFDNKNKSVKVEGLRNTSELPQVNDQVEGILETDKSLRIIKINGKISFGSLMGLMAKTKMPNWGTNDYIRATVVSLTNGLIHIMVKNDNDENGVIKSTCNLCADRVVKVQKGVKCVSCGFFKYKKLASDFQG